MMSGSIYDKCFPSIMSSIVQLFASDDLHYAAEHTDAPHDTILVHIYIYIDQKIEQL